MSTLKGLLRQLSCGELKMPFPAWQLGSFGHPLCTNPAGSRTALSGVICDALPFRHWHQQCRMSLRLQELVKGPVQTTQTVSDGDGKAPGLHLAVYRKIILKSNQTVCLFLRKT